MIHFFNISKMGREVFQNFREILKYFKVTYFVVHL